MHVFLVVVLILLVTGVNAAVIIRLKSLVHPALLLSFLFGVQMVAALLLLEVDIGGVYYGFFWLFLGITAFSLGAALTQMQQAKREPRARGAGTPEGYAVFDGRVMLIAVAVLLLFSFAQPIYQIYRLGYSTTDLFHLSTLIHINKAAADERYVTHSANPSMLAQLFLVLVYLLPLIGGWNFVYARKIGSRLLYVCTVAPSLLVLFTQNTKAAFIGSVFLFIASGITAKIQKSGAFYRVSAKHLLLLLPVAALFLLLNYVSFFFRYGSSSRIMTVNVKMLNYMLGQMPAFNFWFSKHITAFSHTFGLKTFYSVSNSLGFMKRVSGIYPEKLITVHLNTNVYTAFRPLIEDFSAIGALVVLFGLGALAGFCFERVRAGRARCVDLAFLTALNFYIFYAFITTAWAYASYTAAVAAFFIYLLLIRRHILFSCKKASKGD